MVVAGILGIVLALIEYYFPKVARWLPSPIGLGIALVVPFSNSFMMFLGAFLGWFFMKVKPQAAEKLTVPISSGVIAGESIMGIITTILLVSGVMR
jgi:uncharacterized oligopeptide transporter (OPT) family protein